MSLTDPPPRPQPAKHALYYPCIHFRDPNWLKATLLTFRQVKRMVPPGFELRDHALVKGFLELEGPVGPLLDSANLASSRVWSACGRLAKLIDLNAEYLQKNYSKPMTPLQYRSGSRAFQLH